MNKFKSKKIYVVVSYRLDNGEPGWDVNYVETYGTNIMNFKMCGYGEVYSVMLCNSKKEAEEIVRGYYGLKNPCRRV